MLRITTALTALAAALAACQDSLEPNESPSALADRQASAATGSLHVTVSTTGAELDLNGYTVRVDGTGSDHSVATNGSVVIDGLKAGKHTVGLGGVQINCASSDPAPDRIHIAPHRVREVAFSINCKPAVFDGIAFASDRSGNLEIYVAAPDGSGIRQVTNDWRPDDSPTVSPDGTTIVFTRDVTPIPDFHQPQVVAINADGSGTRRLTDSLHADYGPVSWSPDGERIAFNSDGDGSNLDIYLMNPDGSGLTRLTDHAAADLEPTWSPDGAKIAFLSYRGGNPDIYVMNTDGSGVTQITNDVAIEISIAWSPDGSKFAFERGGDIYVMNVDGSGVTKLTDNPAFDGWPAWSPDGSKILFNTTRDGNFEIYVMNADGTGVTRVTNAPGRDWTPTWSPHRR